MSDWIENNSVIGGSTSKSIRLELVNTDGTAKTDAAYTDVTAYYYRPGDSAITSITMATLAAVDTAYSSGGFKHVSNGVYRFDIPDAAIAAITGGGKVLFTVSVSGCFPCNFELSIVSENASTVKAAVAALNNVSAADVNAQCDTAISDAALATAANLATVDTVVDAIKAKTDNLPASPAAVGSAMALTSAYDAAKTAAQASDIPSASTVASAVWSAGTRSLTTFGTLVSDIWANASRTLTAISDSTGITTLLTRLASALTITNGKVDVNDKTGFGLASTERVKLDASQPDYAPAKAGDGMVATSLPDPAPDGYGGSFDGNISGLTDAQAAQLETIYTQLQAAASGDSPVIALPSSPSSVSMSQVFGLLRDAGGTPAKNARIVFTLMAEGPAEATDGAVVTSDPVIVLTDEDGYIHTPAAGDIPKKMYREITRNDLMSPPGTAYRVTCAALKLDKTFTITTEQFDFSTIWQLP